jgi:polyhydroxyalkanoate synthesis regulator phasin
MPTWLEELGFASNPFYLDPVPSEKDSITKDYVDRLKEGKMAHDFMELRSGKLIILGKVGEGKSSLLNLMDVNAEESGKLVMRIDIQQARTKELFIEAVLTEAMRNADKIPDKQKTKLRVALDELQIVRKKGAKAERLAASIEGKLGAVLAYLKAKIGAEETKVEEIEYYVPPRLRKLEGIASTVLPVIFDSVQVAVLCDNLEKLPDSEFKEFLRELITALPTNILLVVTANITELEPQTLERCYQAFDVPLLMDKIDSLEKLAEFIDGRMIKHSLDGKLSIRFERDAIALLLDRTGGNLRETFRYCLFALQRFKTDIKEAMMLEAIRDCDAPRFEVFSETDKKLLKYLATEESISLQEIFLALKKDEGVKTKDALRKRLDNLAVLQFVRKELVKSGRTYIVTYSLPKTLKLLFASA